MDRERLDRLMTDPSRVKREDIADLQAMTERYPWFSGAHLLLAVGEHAAGDLLFDEQLRTTAAHLPSRAVLFDHVSTKAQPPAPEMVVVREERPVAPARTEEGITTPPLAVVPKDPMPVAETRSAPVDEEPPAAATAGPVHPVAPPEPVAPALPALEPIAEASFTPPTEAAATLPVTQEASALPEPRATREEVASTVPDAEAPDAAADPLDLQIREAALASSYELTWDFEAELAAARATPVTFEDAPALPAPPPVPPVPMEAPIHPSTRKRFTDWLDLAPPAEPADLPADLRLDQIAPAPDAIDWLREGAPTPGEEPSPAAPPAASTEPGAPADTRQLIDRFIQQAAGQPTKKIEFFTPQQAAKRSLEDHADLVSETLARVYEKQGNYAKAIAAYERLALKHPDKSTYFAALSEALRARSNR